MCFGAQMSHHITEPWPLRNDEDENIWLSILCCDNFIETPGTTLFIIRIIDSMMRLIKGNFRLSNSIFRLVNNVIWLINPWRPPSNIIKKPITTPGKARGSVRIDNSIFLPRNLFLTRNIPAVVETAKAAKVVANETRTVSTNVFMYLGFLIISR